MLRRFSVPKVMALALLLLPSFVLGDSLLNVGVLSLDPVSSTTATFDIYNLTGANALPPDFNVVTPVTFSNILLTLNFVGGGIQTEDPTNFTPDGSNGYQGLFNIDLTQFPLVDAVLSGVFGSSDLTLADNSNSIIAPDFVTTLSSAGSLAVGDSTSIDATVTPEPISVTLAGAGLALVALARRRSK